MHWKSLRIIFFCGAALIASSAQTLTTLVNFNDSNGEAPEASLIQGTDGNFYGTTSLGGAYFYGTIFRVTPGGTLTTLYSFCGQPLCPDGSAPSAGLVQGTDGNFYGVTVLGGSYDDGTVFKITSQGHLTTLHNFEGSDGLDPEAPLVQAADGNFYGTTLGDIIASYGTVFRITPGGTLTTLHAFTGGADGGTLKSGLVEGTDGNLYGTTYSGGVNCPPFGCGTVFKITLGGTLTTLYSFSGTDGSAPSSGLVQGTDGNFYGTTFQGGANNDGVVYKITPAGVLTTLYSFCFQNNCPDGFEPYAGLIQATDGNFYGTTQANNGTIFRITPTGTLTTLHSFENYDGYRPSAGLVQGTDGSLYGTTEGGGSGALGTVFSLAGALIQTPVQFVPITPCRVVDTRNENGMFGGPPIDGGTYRTFPVPLGSCDIPPNATAYSLNVTVVPSGSLGYLTVWPSGKSRPLVSTMNSLDGRIKANAAIVPTGATGAVSVYVSNTTNVVLDIDGYFTSPSGSTLAFYPLAPCRVLDTRNANGDLGGPYLHAGQQRNFPVQESNCGLPSSAQAYSLNFTAVPYQGESLGYLTVWPTGQSKPLVSTLNNLTGTIVANAAMMHQQVFEFLQAVQVHLELRVAPTRILTHVAAAEAILGALDVLLFADMAHHLIDQQQQAPSLRRRLIQRAPKHLMRKLVGHGDIVQRDFEVLHRLAAKAGRLSGPLVPVEKRQAASQGQILHVIAAGACPYPPDAVNGVLFGGSPHYCLQM